MLERDYIMRLIQEFMAALERMLEKKEVTDRREEIRTLYDKYVGPYALYYNATIDEVMQAIQSYDVGQRIQRLEMLAELYYVEADMVSKPDRDFLLEKAFALFDFIDRNGKTYSFDRLQKMDDIRKKLTNSVETRPVTSQQTDVDK
jgi:hypothetical protein